MGEGTIPVPVPLREELDKRLVQARYEIAALSQLYERRDEHTIARSLHDAWSILFNACMREGIDDIPSAISNPTPL